MTKRVAKPSVAFLALSLVICSNYSPAFAQTDTKAPMSEDSEQIKDLVQRPVSEIDKAAADKAASDAQLGNQAHRAPETEVKSESSSELSKDLSKDLSGAASGAASAQTNQTIDKAAISIASPVFTPEETKNLEVLQIIDNDELNNKVEAEYKWEEIPDVDGKTHIQAGAKFPICVVTSHSSKTAKVGDPVEGKLKISIKIGGREIAHEGAVVNGHVVSVAPARRILAAELAPTRWMRAAGALGVQFDEIVTDAGEHIPLVATPATASRVVKNTNEGRILGVNQSGQLASPLSIQLKHQALHLAIRAGAAAGGVFSFGAVPAAYGVIGAINPSFAFMQPVGKNVRHRRLKGFGMGVVSGLPGGFLISDSMIRGPEAIVKPGDIFLAEFKQDFTGEASSDAELLPNAKAKVHGEVMPVKKKP